MNIEQLPDELIKAIRCLGNGSLTIEADIKDALEEAADLRDFEERVYGAMNRLIEEAQDAIKEFKHRKLKEKERDRMIDLYASGPLSYRSEIDGALFLLGLVEFYDSDPQTKAVVAKLDSKFFFVKNGTVLTEWYGEPKEESVPDTPIEMDEFREMAADVIDEVTEAIQEEYPDLKVKPEFLEECPDAAILYGPSYYNLESRIEDQLRSLFVLRNPSQDKKPEPPEVS
ncbi:MAG: hypothetical protein OI715_01170 (plasmid) [Candidatus Methanoperedens sp.]|nr:MAG: hypothetical protein OI715_01170 [Candidatus Methanoperedens sp.]